MQLAYQQALIAKQYGEIPVGAIIVCNGKILAKSFNQTEKLCDVTAHAEILAITSASNYLGNKYLNDCILYIILEPCIMCAGALYWSRIGTVVIGARAINGFISLGIELHSKTNLIVGILEKKCLSLIKEFFYKKRKIKKLEK